MSDTPLTDAAVTEITVYTTLHGGHVQQSKSMMVSADFARELERENARLMQRESEAVMQATRDAERADRNAAECGRLNAEIARLKEAVKSVAFLMVTHPHLWNPTIANAWVKIVRDETPCTAP